MNLPCASSSWSGLFLGAQASLPAAFRRGPAERSMQARIALPGKRLLWLIVTAFPLTTSPTLFAQTNDGAGPVRRRVTDASEAAIFGFRAARQLIATEKEEANFRLQAPRSEKVRV